MLHFAPRYGLISPCLKRPSRRPLPHAANDDGAPLAPRKVERRLADDRLATAVPNDSDAVLTAALRLFATHGLSAASHACYAAAEAEAKGDTDGIQWWLSVCRTLDRRKAREFQAEARQRRALGRA